MSVAAGLAKFTLGTVHGFLRLRNSIATTFGWLWICLLQLTSSKYKGKKLENIAADAKELEKMPHHLAVIVNEGVISCDDLAKVSVWAFASGVRTISFYDHTGKIVGLKSVLQSRISCCHQQLFSPPLPNLRVCTSREQTSLQSSAQNYDDTGICQVVLLSPEDGRLRLAEVASEVCRGVVGRKERLDQINVDTLTPRVTGAVGLDDPELVLLFGDTCSTLGYPPWLLRLSEMHTLSSHHKVQYKDFHRVLQKYSSCKQRLGK